MRLVAGRKIYHGEARAVSGRRGAENSRAHILDVLADWDGCRRMIGAPYQCGDGTQPRIFSVRRGAIDQNLRDITGIVASDDSADRRVVGLVGAHGPTISMWLCGAAGQTAIVW